MPSVDHGPLNEGPWEQNYLRKKSSNIFQKWLMKMCAHSISMDFANLEKPVEEDILVKNVIKNHVKLENVV